MEDLESILSFVQNHFWLCTITVIILCKFRTILIFLMFITILNISHDLKLLAYKDATQIVKWDNEEVK